MNEKHGYAEKQINSWLEGVSYEVAFWNGFLSNKRNAENVFERISEKRELVLSGINVSEEFSGKDKPTVLDVGCGMVYANGTQICGKDTDYRYIDPLAQFYNDIAQKKGLNLPKISFGMVEYISGFFNKNSVDLIIIQNALDHSFDPVKGIIECMSILKSGGILYLMHRKNEAEYESYRGFHQFNITNESENLICWNKSSKTDVSEMLKDIADTRIVDMNDHVVAIITKKSDFDIESFFSVAEDKQRLSLQLMYLISKIMDRKFTSAYSRRFSRQKASHLVSGKLSSDFKAKIKSIISRKKEK